MSRHVRLGHNVHTLGSVALSVFIRCFIAGSTVCAKIMRYQTVHERPEIRYRLMYGCVSRVPGSHRYAVAGGGLHAQRRVSQPTSCFFLERFGQEFPQRRDLSCLPSLRVSNSARYELSLDLVAWPKSPCIRPHRLCLQSLRSTHRSKFVFV